MGNAIKISRDYLVSMAKCMWEDAEKSTYLGSTS